jgi:peptidoglycan/LPS O-acetylase OafA/YrhL
MEYKKNEQTFPALTGVRAVAAYMVFFHHYIGTCHTENFLSFVKEFYTGVTIFFVLSGFLIYYRYSDSAKLEGSFLFGYFKNRLARIYPTYFFFVIITAVFNFYNLGSDGILNQITLILLQLTFIRGFFDNYKFIGVGQGWTLTVEESFYALFPFFVSIIKKWGFLVTLLIVYLAGILLIGIGSVVQFRGFFFPLEFVINYTFFGRATEFFCGMYLAKILLTKGIKRSNNWVPKFTLLGLTGVVAGIFLMSKIQEKCTYGTFYLGGMIINNLILPAFISILFYGLIVEGSLIQRFLGSRPMVFFGKASYVFYLIHVGVIQFILEHAVSSNMFIIFIIMNLLAAAIYLSIEEPMRKLIRQTELHRR